MFHSLQSFLFHIHEVWQHIKQEFSVQAFLRFKLWIVGGAGIKMLAFAFFAQTALLGFLYQWKQTLQETGSFMVQSIDENSDPITSQIPEEVNPTPAPETETIPTEKTSETDPSVDTSAIPTSGTTNTGTENTAVPSGDTPTTTDTGSQTDTGAIVFKADTSALEASKAEFALTTNSETATAEIRSDTTYNQLDAIIYESNPVIASISKEQTATIALETVRDHLDLNTALEFKIDDRKDFENQSITSFKTYHHGIEIIGRNTAVITEGENSIKSVYIGSAPSITLPDEVTLTELKAEQTPDTSLKILEIPTKTSYDYILTYATENELETVYKDATTQEVIFVQPHIYTEKITASNITTYGNNPVRDIDYSQGGSIKQTDNNGMTETLTSAVTIKVGSSSPQAKMLASYDGQQVSKTFSTGTSIDIGSMNPELINTYRHSKRMYYMLKTYFKNFTLRDNQQLAIKISSTPFTDPSSGRQGCNAYYTNNSINLFGSYDGSIACNAGAYYEDISYHELGHFVNELFYNDNMLNGSLHEGLADVYAFALTNDLKLGEGWLKSGQLVRDYNNPKNVSQMNNEVHNDGQPIAAAYIRLGLSIGIPQMMEILEKVLALRLDIANTSATATQSLYNRFFDATLDTVTAVSPNCSAVYTAFSSIGITSTRPSSRCTGGSVIHKFKCSETICMQDDSAGTFSDGTCGGTCKTTNTNTGGNQLYSCKSGICSADANGTFTGSDCNNSCNTTGTGTIQKYSCLGGACKADANGIYTGSTCNNMCMTAPGSGCSYICLTPSTVSMTPNTIIFAGAQSCTTPGTGTECSGTTKCSGICEDKSRRCSSNSDCPSNIKCTTRDQAQEGPCGGIPKYKCVAGGCLRDDAKGTFTNPTCNNMCGSSSGYICQGTLPANANACNDGPVLTDNTMSYTGQKSCSPTTACDRVCASGYGLINGACVSYNGNCVGTIPSNATVCNDGPAAGVGASYNGATACSVNLACDWTCNSGYSLSNGACIANGNTGSGSNGSGSTTNPPITGTTQVYPALNYATSISSNNAKPGDILTVKADYSYTSYSPNYPLGSVTINETLLSGTEYIANSYSYLGAGRFDRVYQDGANKVSFTVALEGTPSSSDNNSKTRKGTVEYKLRILNTASNGVQSYQSSLSCQGLPNNLAFLGAQSCGIGSQQITAKTTSATLTISGGSNSGPINTCTPSGLEQLNCANGKDDDCDGYNDCNDTDCKNMAICLTNPGTGHNAPPTTGSTTTGNTIIGCQNGKLEGIEQCDDGNKNPGDGCSPSCQIEAGWKCTIDQPSQCGTIDCFSHGQYYRSDNIFGTCCSGLEGVQVNLEINGSSGATAYNYTICYDPQIDEPICLRQSPLKEGRYVKKQKSSAPELSLAGVCTSAFKDYYALLAGAIKEHNSYCAYEDIDYDKVNFHDISKDREQAAIQALQEFCIIKGRGKSLTRFEPNERISRAEFLKILIKTLYMGEMQFSEDGLPNYVGGEQSLLPVESPYIDVLPNARYAQYIAKAHSDGLLKTLDRKSLLPNLLRPQSSITTQEIIDIMTMVTEGQEISEESIKEILGNSKYPTRSRVSSLIVKKFMPKFAGFFYMQGNNPEYYKMLLGKLRGQKYASQYQILLDQLGFLESKEKEHGSAELLQGINSYRIRQFLKHLFIS